MRGEDEYQEASKKAKAETPPRAWGRHALPCSVQRNGETPPRAWGRLNRGELTKNPTGNTPTCVGKTGGKKRVSVQNQKHPHVRGEDLPIEREKIITEETPPRAWGRRHAAPRNAKQQGNTPTCVGKTLGDNNEQLGVQKHPHVRGEDANDGKVTLMQVKHPHVRGEDTERLFTFFIEPSKQY